MIAQKLYFTSIHPLNFGRMTVIAEEDFEAGSIENFRSTVTLFEDVDGQVKVVVCYVPLDDPGNVDSMPCFQAVVGPRSEIADPLAQVGSLSEVREACDERKRDTILHWQNGRGH